MFRHILTRVGVPTVVPAVLLLAGPVGAQHHGGGGFGGGFHSGSPHVGVNPHFSGNAHGSSFHPGGFRSDGFHSGGFHSNNFHSSRFYGGGYYPGYYGYYPSPGFYSFHGSYPADSYNPSYDLGYGSAPDLGDFDSYGAVAPPYSSGYQSLEPPPTVNPDTASVQGDSTVHVRVRVPANAKLWIDGAITTSTGSIREFQSPPLTPGQYTYELRARWTENSRDVTQTQKVAVSPRTHITVDFPIESGTNLDTGGG